MSRSLLNFWCYSANSLKANMTSIVDCPTVEPECWALQYLSSRGWMCGESICANACYQFSQDRFRVVVTVIRLRSFMLVESDNNAFFPFSWNSSRVPYGIDYLVQSFTYWLFGIFQMLCSYVICTCSSSFVQSSYRSGYFMQHRYIFRERYMWLAESAKSYVSAEGITVDWLSLLW